MFLNDSTMFWKDQGFDFICLYPIRLKRLLAKNNFSLKTVPEPTPFELLTTQDLISMASRIMQR